MHKHAGDDNNRQSVKKLRVVFFLNLGFTVLEFAGGLYVNSITIISDALHDFGDSLSLGVAWILQKKSQKGATRKYTFGYSRFSLLGALINSLILIAGSVFIISESTGRILEPERSDARGMLILSLIGIAVNGYAFLKLRSGKSLNERVAGWHLLEDVLGWIAVLIASVILLFKDIPYLDPVLALLITLFILYKVIIRMKETMEIFLQGVPEGINPDEIKEKIMNLQEVDTVHHLHIWALEGENLVFTAHVKLKEIQSSRQLIDIKNKIKEVLSPYKFSHYTIETELFDEPCELDDE